MNRCLVLLFIGIAGCATAPAPVAEPAPKPAPTPEDDVAAAKGLFERNIAAIQNKDKGAYLACYRADDRLVRAGSDGVKLGFAELASSTSSVASEWPTSLEAFDMTLHPVHPGIVYGAYRYRVTIKGTTTEGWSERVFVKDDEGWRIAVTTAFETTN